MFISGNFVGWASPVQIKMKHDETPFKCTDAGWGWVVSFYSLGAAPWCIVAGTFADMIGRRPTLLLAGPSFLLAWIINYFAYNCYCLLASRLVSGGGGAIASAVSSSPRYIRKYRKMKLKTII